jgi:hypothetical protein
MARDGRVIRANECPLSKVKRTSLMCPPMSANDPKRTQETLVLEFFQSARVNGTIGVQALRGSQSVHHRLSSTLPMLIRSSNRCQTPSKKILLPPPAAAIRDRLRRRRFR